MSTTSYRSAAHNVTFSSTPITHTYAKDDTGNAHASSSSSPAPLIPASSSPIRQSEIVPLGPAKTVASIARRAVFFSPRNDTKYFHSDDSIIPSPTRAAPPPSIRAYPDSDPVTSFDTPLSCRFKNGRAEDTPPLVRSILKARAEQIRLAASVEEGTLNNKEAARLLVSGRRPTLQARDSFQLALMRQAAGDGVNVAMDGKGKGRMSDEIPGSDDSAVSTNDEERPEAQHVASDGSSEEEEELEEDGALATASLIKIILEEPEDLLTLEEAYNTLVCRLRDRIPTGLDDSNMFAKAAADGKRIATQPIRDEAPAMIRALQRDLQRLLGKVSSSEVISSDGISSPFRDLMPLRSGTPLLESRGRYTPSPTPNPAGLHSSPTKPTRQCYTEAEVRYRREAAGVGAAVLRFLAFTFCTSQLYSCFTDADLQSLLEQVMVIPRTPRLPTPNTKRTYYLSILAIAQMNLPAACILPVKEKVVRALEGALTDSLGTMGGVSSKEGPSATKKEGYHAVTHLVSTYPSIFFPFYVELLPSCLRGLTSASTLIRYKAAAAVSAFARAKILSIAEAQALFIKQRDAASKDAWAKAKSIVQKSEFFVVAHLKGALKLPGKASPVYGKDGEKKTEWHNLDQYLKDGVGSTTDVHWACAVWAVTVTLMGSAYGTSGLAVGFNHIMERSLAVSTNLYRPLLARIAWNHAIHAYFSSGFASSIAEGDGHLIRSYKPFASHAQQTIEERTAKIQFAANDALSQATNKTMYARALLTRKTDGTTQHVWQRSEKTKKMQWLITCGLGATAVIYAYSGMAVCHEDQPAKEMTAISGLPSSDGIPVPDITPDEHRLPRLDNAWDKVVYPMLKAHFAICGVDRLTVNGWAMLDAITLPVSKHESSWSLDRLLAPRYMSGEVFSKDKDTDLGDLLEDLSADSLQAVEIPAWGQFWVAKRLGRVLALFDDALSSINGMNHLTSVAWIKSANDIPLLPVPLSNIWSNLLHALNSVNLPNAPPTPLFLAGLQAVTRQIIQIFDRDPKSYVPLCQIDESGQCALDEDEVRAGLASHLFELAVNILGAEILGTVRLPAAYEHIPSASLTPFGADSTGSATASATILSHLLRTKALSLPLQPAPQVTLKEMIGKVLDVAAAAGFAGKLLGEITNQMPWLFEESEELQLDVWRLIAVKWTAVIDIQSVSPTSTNTNFTGALLVSLLSGPFRGRVVSSYWHQSADMADLAIWKELLLVTVLRFRAKRVGSNLGVLESLAGHLSDFLEADKNTSSSTITLSCLAAAISWISFVTSELHHASHYSINENYVPVEFLTLVNAALVHSYPVAANQSDETTQDEDVSALGTKMISPTVGDLLLNLRTVFETIPAEFVHQVLRPVQPALTLWMRDKAGLASNAIRQDLDDLYVSLLSSLGNAFATGHIALTSESMDELIDIYASRIAGATSSAVLLAFQAFWKKTFGTVRIDRLEYSNDVAGFLKDLLSAIPGMIDAPGLSLSLECQMSEEESLMRYPHSQSLRVAQRKEQVEAEPEMPTAEIMNVDIPLATGSYDADVSQDFSLIPGPGPVQNADLPRNDDDGLLVSPGMSDIGSEIHGSAETSMEIDVPQVVVVDRDEDGDVFGPAAMTRLRRKAKGKKKAGRKVKNWKGKSREKTGSEDVECESLPEIQTTKSLPTNTPTSTSLPLPDIKPPSLAGDSDDDSDCIIVQPSPSYYKRRGMIVPQAPAQPELVDKVFGSELEPETDDGPRPETEAENDQESAVLGLVTPIEQDEEEEDNAEEGGEEAVSPTPAPTPFSRPITLQPHREPSVSANLSVNHHRPSSLLVSASRWLSRASSSFFSPGPPSPVSPHKSGDSGLGVEHPMPSSVREQQVDEEMPMEHQQESRISSKRAERRASKRKAREMEAEAEVGGEVEAELQGRTVSAARVNVEVQREAQSFAGKMLGKTSSESSIGGKGKKKAMAQARAAASATAVMDVSQKSAERASKRRRSSKGRSRSLSKQDSCDSVSTSTSTSTSAAESPLRGSAERELMELHGSDDDDEDELLLSPESASRRKREEEEAIRQEQLAAVAQAQAEASAALVQAAAAKTAQSKTRARHSVQTQNRTERSQSRSQTQSGRFDDAPNDPSPVKTPAKRQAQAQLANIGPIINADSNEDIALPGPSPMRRTSQQSKVLAMVEEAARAKDVIDDLDYEGVKSMLRHLNELRDAAEGRMMAKMEQLRRERK